MLFKRVIELFIGFHPERIEEPDNLIEGYEWCVSTLSDNTVPREIRSFCAAQVGDFDEMLQEEEIEI